MSLSSALRDPLRSREPRPARSPRQRRARMLLLLLLSAMLLLLALPLSYIHAKFDWATAVLADLEPRHARLLGLEHKSGEIEQARVQASAALEEQAYPASIDHDRAGSDLQQRLRRIAEAQGLSILGSQITSQPAPAAGEHADAPLFERISVSIKLETDLGGVQELLDALLDERPVIHVASLGLQPQRVGQRRQGSEGGGDGQLNVELVLLAFRLLE